MTDFGNLIQRRLKHLGRRAGILYVDSSSLYDAEGQLTEPAYTQEDIIADSYNAKPSWQEPYKYLQSALNAAVNGDKIYVKAGVYHPTHLNGVIVNSTEQSIDVRITAIFQSSAAVEIYGGFLGYETDEYSRYRDADGFMINDTLISGNILNLSTAEVIDETIFQGERLTAYAKANICALAFDATNSTLDGVSIKYFNNGNSGGIILYQIVANSLKYIKAVDIAIQLSANRSATIKKSDLAENCLFENCSHYVETHNGATLAWNSGINIKCVVSKCYVPTTIRYSTPDWNGGVNVNCISRFNKGVTNSVGYMGGTNYGCILYGSSAYYLAILGTSYNCVYMNCSDIVYGFRIGNYNASNISQVQKNSTIINNIFSNTGYITLNNFTGGGAGAPAKFQIQNCVFAGNRRLNNTRLPFVGSILDRGVVPVFLIHNISDGIIEDVSDAPLTVQFGNISSTSLNITKIELPPFDGLPTTNISNGTHSGLYPNGTTIVWDNAKIAILDEYVRRIIENDNNPLKPQDGSILYNAGLNSEEYPAPTTDFYDNARPAIPENVTLGIIQ